MKKIRTKIIIAYLLLAVAVIVGSDFMVSWRIGAFLQQRIIADLDRQSDVLLYILRSDSSLTGEHTYTALQKIGSIEHVRITLIDSSGRVIADSDIPFEETAQIKNHLDRPEVQQALQNGFGSDIRTSATLDRPFLYHVRMVHEYAAIGKKAISFVPVTWSLVRVPGLMNLL